MVLVDHCLRIDLRELGLFKHPLYSVWTITKGGLLPERVIGHLSRDTEGSPVFCIASEVVAGTQPATPLVQGALLEPTYCSVRGRQWWFRCPRCGRRCRVLYRPRGESDVGCISCHRLTYRSRQQHRSRFYETVRVLDTVPRILDDLHARRGSRRRFRAMCQLLPELKAVRRTLNAWKRPRQYGPMADPVEKPVRLDERLALRPAEAARALGIGERTLRQLLPTLPHVRAGGTVLLPVEGLRRWLEEQAKSEGTSARLVADEMLSVLAVNLKKS